MVHLNESKIILNYSLIEITQNNSWMTMRLVIV